MLNENWIPMTLILLNFLQILKNLFSLDLCSQGGIGSIVLYGQSNTKHLTSKYRWMPFQGVTTIVIGMFRSLM
ncbi:hypothetical protein D7U36_13050 [Propionibacterium australiense]|uniref:Uncharacterized protein n=1 Tax=Propionibacterium australiense TaxID=119981 RepID=A0A8B3FGZ1_9ACTN|nr:hypothetical protein D7U36_13050 [Propionibacterium australiense]